MARCGCSATEDCNCAIQAGTGITVSGAGTPLNPYVVSAEAADCTAVRACISAGQGITYSAASGVVAAKLSTDPNNTVVFGSDGGLYATVDCAQVRPCISATGGAAYDSTTGVITADLSTDVGNTISLGGDGGLFVPAGVVSCAQVRPCISATGGVNYDSATGVITADISTDPGNTTILGGDGGLYTPAAAVSCAQVRPCISAGQGATYNSATGVVGAQLSTDAGNTVAFGTDNGLYVPAGAVTCAQVRPCISAGQGATYNSATGVMSARLSTDAGNTAVFGTDSGLYVPAVTCAQVRPCISAGQGATYNSATGVVSARLSTDAGNTTVFGTDGGLYTPPVTCAQVRACLSGTNGVTYTPGTGVIEADISTDAGNLLKLGTDTGLYASVTTGCGLDGAGTTGDPLNVPVAAWPFPCSVDTFGGDVYCDSTGKLRTTPRPTVVAQQTSQDQNYPATAVPTATDVSVEIRTFNVTNPDTCRPAFVIFEAELDVDLTLPANSSAMYGIGGDDMVRMQNRGTGTESAVHVQVTKAYNRVIPAGGSLLEPFDIHMGMGTGGATYSRIQTIHRAFVFNL